LHGRKKTNGQERGRVDPVLAKELDKAAKVPDGCDDVAGPDAEDDKEDDVPVPDASMKTAGTAPPGKTDLKPVNVGGADAMTKAVDVPGVPSCADSSASTGENPAEADPAAADGAMDDPAAADGATADPAAADGAMACPGEEPPVR
jgi:hypothetical protein